MRTVKKRTMFSWTLRGKPYFLLSTASLAILLVTMGVML